MTGYAELQVTSNYSFLRGASHMEELFEQAKHLGLAALAITDRNTLAGIVRAHQRAREAEVRLVVGCRLDLEDGTALLAYPTDRPAYARLCHLLTRGKDRAGKGACRLGWDDVAEHGEGLIATLVPDLPDETTRANLARLRSEFDDRAYLALSLRRRPGDALRLHALAAMAQAARVPTVATGDVLYHVPERRILQDVLGCIREGCTIEEAGFRRERFADRHLKAPAEMERLFARHPDAVTRSLEIMERCRFKLSELQYQYPIGTERPEETAQQALERMVWAALPGRYPGGASDEVVQQLRHELDLIARLDYAPYFLTVNSIVRYAKSQDILCQGRGSAANSAVCYVLGITSIDAVESKLLFERFVSAERNEPPDIDVDFEHEQRETVIQWIYNHYGRDRAALCATLIRYRARGAVRDVGKVMGLTEDVTAMLSRQVGAWVANGIEPQHAEQLNLDLTDRRLRLTLELARELIGFPRHLSQHPGGFVLTQTPLADLVPIEPARMEDRQVIEWDKDDIDVLKFMKVDVLGLGMLGCLRRAFNLLATHKGERLKLTTVPQDDPATYKMIQKADTLGTFQIESRAQMSMLPRLKPKELYDLVIQVAIVRPGPIQGDMVHPYLRRRMKLEREDYPSEELKPVLEKTLGIPLFQEQAMQVAMICAGFTAGEADELRRAMATFKNDGHVSRFREKMISGMLARGYKQEFAQRIFKQIEGFGSYGFPESHAASFASLAYVSAWFKCRHPDVFCAALLNAQPMGFYAPAQIVRDAQNHKVEIRPVCVQTSLWDCTLEPSEPLCAVRLGLRMVKGLSEADAIEIVKARGDGFASVEAVHRRSGVPTAVLERLAEADGFHALGLDRRAALWALRGLAGAPLPLFAGVPEAAEPPVSLTPMTAARAVVEDYHAVGLSLRAHPVSFLRATLKQRGMIACGDLAKTRAGTRVVVPGIILVRQQPGSSKGVIFITIEDETGIANLVLWRDRFETYRRLVLSARMIACRGRVQNESGVIHVVVEHLEDLTGLLHSLGETDDPADGIRVPTRDFR